MSSATNNIRPTTSRAVMSALASIRPMIEQARQRVNAIPTIEMLNSFTGKNEIVRIATAEMLQRIVMDTFKLRLIVDTHLVDSGSTITVMATIYILTEDGYQPLRSAHASETRGAGNFSPVLSAESRAIRLALRGIGLRAEGEVFGGETAEQLADATTKVSNSNTIDSHKEPQSTLIEDNAVSSQKTTVKTASKTTSAQKKNSTPVTTGHSDGTLFGIDIDKTAVDYVDKLRQILRVAKSSKAKSKSMGDFIQSALGPDSPRRLEGCTTALLERLVSHYASDDDCAI